MNFRLHLDIDITIAYFVPPTDSNQISYYATV